MTINTISARGDSDLGTYLTDIGDLPPEILLGRIVMYTISDEPVPHATLEQWMTELGLNKAFMPPQLRDLDAFKKATSGVNNISYDIADGKRVNLLCRDVTANKDMVIRRIVREVRDSANKQLSYDTAIECKFFRQSAKGGTSRLFLTISPEMPAAEYSRLHACATKIGKSFSVYQTCHDGQKMRALVRNYMGELNGIEIKSGVYFVHASRDEELGRLSDLVNRIGGRSFMNTVPLANTVEQKTFVTRAFEREAEEQLTRLARDAREILNDGRKTTLATASNLKKEFDTILDRAQEHMMRLQVVQDVTAASAEIALREIEKVMKSTEVVA